MPNILLGSSEGQLQIAPERMEFFCTKVGQCSAVGISGGESKVYCYKEQHCIGTWNVSSMNQGKLYVVKQEMARWNIYISGISELKR